MIDFIVIKQQYYSLFKAESSTAKEWAFVHWDDNMKRVTSDLEAEITSDLEKLGFSVEERRR